MALRILHVLSSDFFAGSVAYAIKIAEKQVTDGQQVIMVTDMKNPCDKFLCLELPVSNRSISRRIKNILFLRKVIKQYDISIIHAHSRAASWISYYALKGSKIPLVSTIHGRQVKQRSAKKMDVYGDRVIAICPNLIAHLITEIKLNKEKLIHIPNGFDCDQLTEIKRSRVNGNEKVISVVGRFNGPKGNNFAKLVANVFPNLLEEYPWLTIQLSGSAWESFPENGKEAYETLHSKYPDRIKNLGFNSDVFQMMANSDLVIGAGRVALEGLLLKVPVLAMGEACYHGILTHENIDKAIASNFGDILEIQSNFVPDTDLIAGEIKEFLNNHSAPVDLTDLLTDYHVDKVIQKITTIYRTAILQKVHPKWIPVLMYHKVPDNPIDTKHRIFVTKKNFENHLRFFKLRGLKSITFKDYLDFSNGNKSIKEFPKKPFIITFDDGYRDNYVNMLPLTQRYGFKGVLFLLGDFSVTDNFWDAGEDKEAGRIMTYEQKKAFVEYGWEIGAHTLTHADLTKLDTEKVKNEIMTSKTLLEEKLGTEIVSFAYPYGYYNKEVEGVVKEAGIAFGIATDNGGMTIEENRFAIFRVNMFPEEDFLQLYKKTSSWYRDYYKKKRGK